MPFELGSATADDVNALISKLRAEPELARLTCVQHAVEYSTPPSDPDLLAALNALFEEFPQARFRAYGWNTPKPYNLSYVAHLPAILDLSLHLNGDICGLDAVAGMDQVTTFSGQFKKLTDFSFLTDMTGIEELRLERESKGSVRPSIAPIAELPMLRKLMVIGYKNGVEAIASCAALEWLHLQSITLKRWDILPPHQMDYVCFSFLKGPDGLPDVFPNVADFETRGMNRAATLRFEKVLPKPFERDGMCVLTFNIDELNTHLGGAYLSGHDWANRCADLVEPPEGLRFDPEADGLSVMGPEAKIVSYRLTLFDALRALPRG